MLTNSTKALAGRLAQWLASLPWTPWVLISGLPTTSLFFIFVGAYASDQRNRVNELANGLCS